MKKMVKMYRGSIFRSLFSILTVLILVMTVFNLSMTLFIRNRLFHGKMREQDAYIDAYASFINETFQNLQNVFTYLQRDYAISWRAAPGYRESSSYLENEKIILDLLRTFSFTSISLDDIIICWDDTKYLYTAQGLVEKTVYFKNRFEGNYEEWESVLHGHFDRVTVRMVSGVTPSPQEIQNTNTKTSGIYLLQSIKTNNQKYRGTICMSLKESFVRSIFSDQQFAEGRQIFVLDHDGMTLASNTGAELNDILCGMAMKDLFNTSRYLPKRGLLSHREAAMSGMEYVVFTPYTQIAGTLDRIFLVANLISAVTVLVLLFCAYCSSRHMYKPFRGILNALGERAVRNTKVEDETLYITNQILDILSVNRSMYTTLQSNNHMVLQAVLYKLLMGSPSVEETLMSVKPYNIPISEGVYDTAVIRMDLLSNEEELFYMEYYEVFDRILHAYLGAWVVEVLQTLPDEYTIVLCMKDQTERKELLPAMGEMYEAWCRQIPGAAFYIGISGCAGDIRDLRKCYEKSIAGLSHRPVQSRDAIILAHSDTASEPAPFLPDDLEVKLRGLLEKESPKLENYVVNILEQNYRMNITYEAYLSVCVTINRLISRFVQRKNENLSSDLIKINPSNYVYTAARCREIVLSNLAIAAELQVKTKESVSINTQISAYIDKHFHEDINLASVADELGYTPNYISRYFKQVNGINFTDYLNSRRVSFACELLALTPNNLNQIAEMAGFHGANFFIKVFEKYEGITPGEYRKKMRQKA